MLLALEGKHGIRWWNRDAIGSVVQAGGFHNVIQTRTMLKLSDLSLVLLEVESWPKETRQLVACNCAAYTWGLTDAGRSLAETFKIRWTGEPEKCLDSAKYYGHRGCIHDNVEGRTRQGDRWVSPRVASDIDDDEHDPTDFWKRQP